MPLGMEDIEPDPLEPREMAHYRQLDVNAERIQVEQPNGFSELCPGGFQLFDGELLVVVAGSGDDEVRGLQFGVEIQEYRGDRFDFLVCRPPGRLRFAGNDFRQACRKEQMFADLSRRPAAQWRYAVEGLRRKTFERFHEGGKGLLRLYAQFVYIGLHMLNFTW